MNLIKIFSLITVFGFLAGCGGSSTSSSSSSSAGGVNVDDISGLPSTDVSSYDYSISSSTTTALGFAVGAALQTGLERTFSAEPGAAGGFSRAGCEVNQMKTHMFDPALKAQELLCRVDSMVDAGVFQNPSAVAQIFKLEIKDHQDSDDERSGPGGEDGEGPQEGGGAGPGGLTNALEDGVTEDFAIYFRLAKVDGSMSLHMCFGDSNADDFGVNEEMIFGVNSAGDVGFTVRHRQAFSFSDDQFGSGTFTDQMEMIATHDDAAGGDFTGTARFESTFEETGAGGTFSGGHKGAIVFGRETAVERNTIAGVFKDTQFGDNTFSVNAEWSSAAGVAKFTGSGSMPGFPCFDTTIVTETDLCCFDPENPDNGESAADAEGLCTFTHGQTESYSIVSTTSDAGRTTQVYAIIANDDVLVADFYDDVANASLTEVANFDFAFDLEWDCGIGDAALVTVTDADLANVDMVACDVLSDKAFQEENFNSCFDDSFDEQREFDDANPPDGGGGDGGGPDGGGADGGGADGGGPG